MKVRQVGNGVDVRLFRGKPGRLRRVLLGDPDMEVTKVLCDSTHTSIEIVFVCGWCGCLDCLQLFVGLARTGSCRERLE